MSAPPTMLFFWDGEALTPKLPRVADKHFVVGETYPLAVQEVRSRESHSHFFASIEEGWRNLPEDQAEQFATSEHLRKWCLIKAGYRDERSIVCASKAEALRVAAFIKPMDDYAVVLVSDATIRVFTAKSQSLRAMGKAEFQDSKQKVLDIVSDMIGVDPSSLTENTGRAA